jgi:hypothetical protein
MSDQRVSVAFILTVPNGKVGHGYLGGLARTPTSMCMPKYCGVSAATAGVAARGRAGALTAEPFVAMAAPPVPVQDGVVGGGGVVIFVEEELPPQALISAARQIPAANRTRTGNTDRAKARLEVLDVLIAGFLPKLVFLNPCIPSPHFPAES